MENSISVIILSYNTKATTDKCLQYLKSAIDYSEGALGNKVEAIVIENGSTDGSGEMIIKKHKWVRLINPKVNTGFAKGNNIGMAQAKYDFLLLLNSDAFVKPETLVEALMYFKNHPECDVLGCKLTYENGGFQPSGGYLPTGLNTTYWMFMVDKIPILRNFLKPFHPSYESFFAKERELGWIMGAFMFMKREVFTKTGGFDEKFFLYTEEVEWCKRMNKKGFKVFFTPGFSVTHLKYASSGYNPKKPIIMETAGVLYYFKKHYPDFLLFLRVNLTVGYIVRFAVFSILGNPKAEAYREMLTTGIWKKLP